MQMWRNGWVVGLTLPGSRVGRGVGADGEGGGSSENERGPGERGA